MWPPQQDLEFDFRTQHPSQIVDLLYQVQYGPDYPFENIWLGYRLIGPKGDTLVRSRDNLFLFEPGSGRPIGTGTKSKLFLDAFFLRRVLLSDSGRYQIRLRHYMRADTLIGIQAMGIKVRNSGD